MEGVLQNLGNHSKNNDLKEAVVAAKGTLFPHPTISRFCAPRRSIPPYNLPFFRANVLLEDPYALIFTSLHARKTENKKSKQDLFR